ncbi:hypothetical protein BKA70DRAFT_1283152 [Coprinopsis sp. MPI-PUGE-AT-0042]|nr:hypothetical protein BKA70DRAFT_1283152 [Coprinopsis sp. MPI-PUGE-AT-0042]
MSNITGLQLYLCIQGLCSFYRMPRSARRGRRPYICTMIFTLLASSLVFIADTISKGDLLTEGKIISFDHGGPAPVWSNLMYFLGIGVVHVAGDALLAWRCYMLWREYSRPLGLIPVVPYASSIAMGITHLVAASRLNASLPERHAFYRRVQAAFLFLSLGVNICATTLIILRLRRTDRELRVAESHLNGEIGETPYKKISIMLVESALPFTLFGIAAAIASTLFAANDGLEVETASAINIIWPLWVNSCAIAPQLIIFRVATGASWISSPQQARTRSEPALTTRLSQFLGPSNFSSPVDASKNGLSPAEFRVSQESDLTELGRRR